MKKLLTSIYMLVVGSLLSVGANAQPNLLVAGDFEGTSSVTSYWPATPGVWGAESSALSGAGNGITPFGSQMLQLNHAGGGTAAQTAQIVQGPFVAGSVVTFTAKFNTWLTGQSVRLDIQTNAGLALDGPRVSSPTVALDSNTSTWQTVTVTTTLTSDTNFISAEILLSQNSNGALYGQPRAYVDDAVLTVAPPLPTQTLTILGGSGNAGEIAANVEYYNPATGNWQAAYLASYAAQGHPGGHPWGNIPGTNSWINYKVDGGSDPDAGPTNTDNLWYLYRVRFTVPADAQNPSMTFSIKADNYAQVAINGVSTGPTIDGQANGVNADAVFSQNVQPGENTITINVGDWGGLNGFNFRIDLTVESAEPLEIVPADTTPPVISPLANITTEATGPAGAVVTFSATAVDDKDGSVPVLAVPASGSTFALGTTIVDLGASDSAGNQAFASFSVTVQDTTPPVIAPPADITAEASSAAGASVTFAATAQDLVSGSVPVLAIPSSGSTFALGTSTVDLGASDVAGNIGSATFTITVQDTTAPVLSVPANQTIEATSAAGAVASFSATATDAVGVTSIAYSAAAGSTFALGTTTVNVTTQDAAGNSATGSFTITVVDTTAPVITSVTPSSATLWPPNHQMVPITVSAVATDITGVTSLKIISVTSSEPDNGLGDGDTAGDIQITGLLTVNLRAERSGKGNGRTYTITVEATDAFGNASTRTCTVSVPKSKGK